MRAQCMRLPGRRMSMGWGGIATPWPSGRTARAPLLGHGRTIQSETDSGPFRFIVTRTLEAAHRGLLVRV